MEVIAFANQKGGVGKTTTVMNTGVALAKRGNKVLLVDNDPQHSLTTHLGINDPDTLTDSLTSIYKKTLLRMESTPEEGIVRHPEGVDFLPSNMELGDVEVNLPGIQDREYQLKSHIDKLRPSYDYILLDCGPSLGLLNVNALTAADSVVIPVQPHIFSMKGLELLMRSIRNVQERSHPGLRVKGVLFTLVDNRTLLSKTIQEAVEQYYGKHIHIFKTQVPTCIKAAEAPGQGKSVIAYDPMGRATQAYLHFAREVDCIGREKNRGSAAKTR